MRDQVSHLREDDGHGRSGVWVTCDAEMVGKVTLGQMSVTCGKVGFGKRLTR